MFSEGVKLGKRKPLETFPQPPKGFQKENRGKIHNSKFKFITIPERCQILGKRKALEETAMNPQELKERS
jgi:hypothetical protein